MSPRTLADRLPAVRHFNACSTPSGRRRSATSAASAAPAPPAATSTVARSHRAPRAGAVAGWLLLLLLAVPAWGQKGLPRSGRSSDQDIVGSADSHPPSSAASAMVGSPTALMEVQGINSPARDNTPLITADGRVMFFNSTRRGDRPWSRYNAQRARWDDDIYYSVRTAAPEGEERWSEPVNLGAAINSSEDDGVAAIAPDGRTIYFVSLKKGWELDNGPFYRADLRGTAWSNIKGMGGGLSRFFQSNPNRRSLRVYGASISPDGKDFYFATTAHSETDRHQIWVSHIVDGEWNYPESLGPNINQPAGSYAPFIAADGRTLFFSTSMAGGSGGDDIHYSVLRDGAWEAPVNIGTPINTAGDDAFLSIPASGDRVYLATSRQGNDDVYTTALPEKARPMSVVLLTGRVTNKLTGAPVEATITIEDLSSGTKIFEAQSAQTDGSYTAVLYAGRQYGISVSAPGYVFMSTRYSTPTGAAYTEIDESFPLDQLAAGKSFILNNIFFEYNASTITPGSRLELDRLIQLLGAKPTLRIAVDGFTDNIGSSTFNRQLSLDRARAVRDYLVGSGRIAPERIDVRGFGVERPVAPNETEEGRRRNRRVEFSVLAM